jgi:hypothetical protein
MDPDETFATTTCCLKNSADKASLKYSSFDLSLLKIQVNLRIVDAFLGSNAVPLKEHYI